MGDFNFKEINWKDQCTSVGATHIASKFLEVVRDSYLYQHVKQPTRYRSDNTPSVLDLIFTNEEGMVETVDHCPPLGNSDHEILDFKFVHATVAKTYREEKMRYFKGDYASVNRILINVDWDTLLRTGSIDNVWDRFVDKLLSACKDNIPVYKSKQKHYDTPWMNKEALAAVRNKRKMWKKYIYCKRPYNKEMYEKAKVDASRKVKQAQMQYERDICEKSKDDPKIFWRFVQSKTKIKENIQCLIDDNGDVHTDNECKAELLNKFFQSVFTIEPENDSLPAFNPRTDLVLDKIIFNVETVKKYLQKINENKSQGSDSIHPKLLKETIDSITLPVTNIFNKSMEDSKLPKSWKTANITPIHKKGPKHTASNYRPISLTSILCKVMEKIIRDALLEYMEENGLFTNHQHGFRKGRSCVTQLIEVMEKWTEDLDQKKPIDVIYLDFQKAFDTVPHKRLIQKLRGYGVRGKLLSWIEDFLFDRKQRVVLNGQSSSWTEVTSGIPQGSVLGPILFTIYINDLPDVIENMVKLFADDTKVSASVRNENDRDSLQKDINSLMKWSDTWLLKFNQSKCKHLHLGPETNYSYMMEENSIDITTEEKDLGIIVDDNLNFQNHINKQVKKANQKLGLINRSFKYMDKAMFLQLFKSLVRPHLEYGSSVWSVANKKEAILLENVQRRATKLIRDIQHLTYGERLKHLGIPTLQYRRIRADIVETFKIIKGIDKIENDTIFPINRAANTRGHKYKIYKKHCRTNRRKYSFSQRVVDYWNALPDHVTDAPSTNSFKSRLNEHWKNMEIKFVPDFYGPEAGISRNVTVMDLRG